MDDSSDVIELFALCGERWAVYRSVEQFEYYVTASHSQWGDPRIHGKYIDAEEGYSFESIGTENHADTLLPVPHPPTYSTANTTEFDLESLSITSDKDNITTEMSPLAKESNEHYKSVTSYTHQSVQLGEVTATIPVITPILPNAYDSDYHMSGGTHHPLDFYSSESALFLSVDSSSEEVQHYEDSHVYVAPQERAADEHLNNASTFIHNSVDVCMPTSQRSLQERIVLDNAKNTDSSNEISHSNTFDYSEDARKNIHHSTDAALSDDIVDEQEYYATFPSERICNSFNSDSSPSDLVHIVVQPYDSIDASHHVYSHAARSTLHVDDTWTSSAIETSPSNFHSAESEASAVELVSSKSDSCIVGYAVDPYKSMSTESTVEPIQRTSEKDSSRHLAVWAKFFENALKMNGHNDVFSEELTLDSSEPCHHFSENNDGGNMWPESLSDNDYWSFMDSLLVFKEDGFQTEQVRLQGLLYSILQQDVESAQAILSLGVNPSLVVDSLNRTCLHHACKTGNISMVELLLDANINIELCDIYGYTALHITCVFNHAYITKLLCESAVNVDSIDCQQNTSLHLACKYGYAHCCKHLLVYGSCLQLQNSRGLNAIGEAKYAYNRNKHSNHIECIHLLQAEYISRSKYDDNSISAIPADASKYDGNSNSKGNFKSYGIQRSSGDAVEDATMNAVRKVSVDEHFTYVNRQGSVKIPSRKNASVSAASSDDEMNGINEQDNATSSSGTGLLEKVVWGIATSAIRMTKALFTMKGRTSRRTSRSEVVVIPTNADDELAVPIIHSVVVRQGSLEEGGELPLVSPSAVAGYRGMDGLQCKRGYPRNSSF